MTEESTDREAASLVGNDCFIGRLTIVKNIFDYSEKHF